MAEMVIHELVTVTADEAGRLEEEFLNGLDQAQDAFVQIMETNAWAALGYDSFAAWWETRVVPVMRALSMHPSREIAARVLAQVKEEQVSLPPAQQRRQAELGELVGLSEASVGRLSGSRSTVASSDAKDDLETASDEPPVVKSVQDQPDRDPAEGYQPSLSDGERSVEQPSTEADGVAAPSAGDPLPGPAHPPEAGPGAPPVEELERRQQKAEEIRRHNEWARQVNQDIHPDTRAELDDLGRRVDAIVAISMGCEFLLEQVRNVDPERAVTEAPEELRHKLAVVDDVLTYLTRVADALKRQGVPA